MSLILYIPVSDNRLDLDNWKDVIDDLHSTYGTDIIPDGMADALIDDVKNVIDGLPRHYVGIQEEEIDQILRDLGKIWKK